MRTVDWAVGAVGRLEAQGGPHGRRILAQRAASRLGAVCSIAILVRSLQHVYTSTAEGRANATQLRLISLHFHFTAPPALIFARFFTRPSPRSGFRIVRELVSAP